VYKRQQLDLSPEEIKELANRIEQILTGQDSLFPPSDEIERLAQHYATQLIDSFSKPQVTTKIEPIADYKTIDVQTIEHTRPRTIGSEHLLYHVADHLQLEKALNSQGLSHSQIALAIGVICARAIFPASERATLAWLKTQSGLGELLNFDFQKVSLNQFYSISDVLLKQKTFLEGHINQQQKRIHGHSSTMILYDLTNTYMEGQAKKNSKARFGRSKEKRTDCPLVTLGLVLDEHGFLIRTEFLAGNVSEPSSLEQAINTLKDPEQLFQPTILLDAGIATNENLRWLKENGFSYIVSARQNAPSSEIGALTEIKDSKVRVALVREGEDGDSWLYCESPAKEVTANQMKTLFQQRFESDLQKLSDGLKKPRGCKRYLKIIERLGRLKEKHRRISDCYEIIVHSSPDEKIALGIEWKQLPKKLEKKLTGRYYLRTNFIQKNAEELWTLYQNIRTVEDAFRFMKSSLGMRPVYHQKEKRVDGHLWITVIAYCLLQNLLYQLRQNGITCEWETIRMYMQNRIRISMQAKTQEGNMLHIRTTTKPEEFQKKIYEALTMSSTILRTKKSII